MRNGKVVIYAVKIKWVVQILAVTVLNAFLESKVPSVGRGSAFSTRLQPMLSLLGPLWPRSSLGWNLPDKDVKHDTAPVGEKQEMELCVPPPLDIIAVIGCARHFDVITPASGQHS